MAVAQAQNAVSDLAAMIEQRGATVEYAIHPVAGRMPGHMNVLLAEADVSYEQLRTLEEINPDFDEVGVAIVLGANDVVNPEACKEGTPVSGMPILNVDEARQVVVIKRSLSPGYAKIANPLFAADNTSMLFGDGKLLSRIFQSFSKSCKHHDVETEDIRWPAVNVGQTIRVVLIFKFDRGDFSVILRLFRYAR